MKEMRENPKPAKPAQAKPLLKTPNGKLVSRYRQFTMFIALLGGLVIGYLLIQFTDGGWSRALRDWAFSTIPWSWAAALAYFSGLFIALYVFIIAFSFVLHLNGKYFGYVIVEIGGWAKDQAKAAALTLPLWIAGAEYLRIVAVNQPATWWLWMAAAYVLVFIARVWLAPGFLYPLFFQFARLPDRNLEQRLEAILSRGGAKLPGGIWEWKLSRKSRKANAMLMGWRNNRRVVISDTLLQALTPEETEVILAHEAAHDVHRDIEKRVLATAIWALGTFYLLGLLLAWTSPLNVNPLTDLTAFPNVLLYFVIASLLTQPVLRAYFRRGERSADEFALRLTRNREAFIEAFKKLGKLNGVPMKPSRLVELVFYSHPAIAKRIAFAEERPL